MKYRFKPFISIT